MSRAYWFGALVVVSASVGCKNDNSLTANPIDSVAVTTGDFDYVALPLDRMVIPHESYEGIISVATWDREYDPELVQLKVETLLGNIDELSFHGAVFVASGTRGLGAQQYNGLDPDDTLLTNPAVRDNVRAYVEGGGILIVTDWAYDLVQLAWPELMVTVGDGAFDGAQAGNNGTIIGKVVDPLLSAALGEDSVALEYNYSNWAVVSSVAQGTVHIEGDVAYKGDVDSGTLQLTGAPLLMSWQPEGALGKVVLSTFHFDAQTPEVMDTIVTTVIGEFEEAPTTSLTVARGGAR